MVGAQYFMHMCTVFLTKAMSALCCCLYQSILYQVVICFSCNLQLGTIVYHIICNSYFCFLGLFINNTMFFLKNTIKVKNEISLFNFWNIFRYITLIIPHFSYSSCIRGFLEITWENNRCKVCDMSEQCHGW